MHASKFYRGISLSFGALLTIFKQKDCILAAKINLLMSGREEKRTNSGNCSLLKKYTLIRYIVPASSEMDC
jgi:hypothetical protein